jgi:carbamate kinase
MSINDAQAGDEMRPIVVAIGGNALIKDGQEGNIYQQFANSRETCDHIVKLVKMGYDIVLTHGNGPQVGNALLRHERARDKIPPYPLGVCVAETVGSMGYMLQQTMQNTLKKEGIDKSSICIITQVLVDNDDPAFLNPTKPIGQFFTKEQIRPMIEKERWDVVEDSGRGWRRVVPSPIPKRIIETEMIRQMLKAGHIVIAGGGGGLPVILMDNGMLDGREAVVDKDYASSRLASELDCETFVILTGVAKVCLNYNKADQKDIDSMTASEAEGYLASGQFPQGSMGPKIQAAIDFIRRGGKEVIITDIHLIDKAIKRKAGTHIYPDPPGKKMGKKPGKKQARKRGG